MTEERENPPAQKYNKSCLKWQYADKTVFRQ